MEIDPVEENPSWLFDYGLMGDITAGDFAAPAPAPIGFCCLSSPAFAWSQSSKTASTEVECSFVDSECLKGAGSRKRWFYRMKTESCDVFGSKACREKQRRDRMNERFLELSSILEPGRPPKTDKAAILSDAIREVTHLQSETKRLHESNVDLQEKIKELKAEKNELREEKQRLKMEKEKLEQQVKAVSSQPCYLSHPTAMGPAYAAQGQAGGTKMMPFVSYPGLAMWQFMPPSLVDTSQDHVLHPPVA